MTSAAAAAQLEVDPFVVGLDRFQGPLDLLLHLIRKQDIDIFDIPIARITAQFLAAIREVDRLELDRAGEFVEMAATLVRIKAQMLFPRHEEEDAEDPRADLVRRLLEYEHFREAADRLEQAERERARHFPRGFTEPRAVPSLAEAPLEVTWDEVWAAVLALVERLAEPEPGYTFAARPVRIEEKMEHVLAALRRRERIEFATLVAPWGTRMHAVASLLACLELSRRSLLRLRQSAPFEALWVYRAKVTDDAA
ncbi:MAG TPA: segregation/condensation protein A [Longimicrobiaceae bacterium]